MANIPPAMYDLWTLVMELLMVLYALPARSASFRNRRRLDNVASLMTLLPGRSDSPHLEHMSHMIHTILYALRCWMWWEYVPSKSNWADAISCLGALDTWHIANGFSTHNVNFPSSSGSYPLLRWCLCSSISEVLWVKCIGPGVTRAF